jgi:hypothetical protein
MVPASLAFFFFTIKDYMASVKMQPPLGPKNGRKMLLMQQGSVLFCGNLYGTSGSSIASLELPGCRQDDFRNDKRMQSASGSASVFSLCTVQLVQRPRYCMPSKKRCHESVNRRHRPRNGCPDQNPVFLASPSLPRCPSRWSVRCLDREPEERHRRNATSIAGPRCSRCGRSSSPSERRPADRNENCRH